MPDPAGAPPPGAESIFETLPEQASGIPEQVSGQLRGTRLLRVRRFAVPLMLVGAAAVLVGTAGYRTGGALQSPSVRAAVSKSAPPSAAPKPTPVAPPAPEPSITEARLSPPIPSAAIPDRQRRARPKAPARWSMEEMLDQRK